jgi:DNA-binding response OmpR family regulator
MESHAEPARGPLILLVEDEPLIGLSLQDAVEAAGFLTQLLNCGVDAEAALNDAAVAYSGLVTDIRLGSRISGWDLGRLAREKHANIPVIYMSGDSAIEHGSRGVPGSIMVQKPFAPAQIVTAITTLLNDKPIETRPSEVRQ